jgi:hypothetical protein
VREWAARERSILMPDVVLSFPVVAAAALVAFAWNLLWVAWRRRRRSPPGPRVYALIFVSQLATALALAGWLTLAGTTSRLEAWLVTGLAWSGFFAAPLLLGAAWAPDGEPRWARRVRRGGWVDALLWLGSLLMMTELLLRA